MDFIEQVKRNQEKLDKADEKAKKEGSLVGRYIREPFADGYAVYLIVRENKKTVRIKHVTGLGDDWQIPYWGNEATIDKNYALQNVGARDRLAEIFSK